MAFQGGLELAAGRIPELDGAIACPRSEPSAWEHRQGSHPVGMAFQGGCELAAGWIPELDGAIVCPRSELPVGEHRQGSHRASIAAEGAQQGIVGQKAGG